MPLGLLCPSACLPIVEFLYPRACLSIGGFHFLSLPLSSLFTHNCRSICASAQVVPLTLNFKGCGFWIAKLRTIVELLALDTDLRYSRDTLSSFSFGVWLRCFLKVGNVLELKNKFILSAHVFRNV